MPDSTDDLHAQLDVVEEGVDDVCVLTLRGELDLSTVPALNARLEAMTERGVRAIAVDLLELTFMDSTGLATLLGALRELRRRDGRLALACTNPSVLRLFEITGTNETFDIVATRAEAIERAGAGGAAT